MHEPTFSESKISPDHVPLIQGLLIWSFFNAPECFRLRLISVAIIPFVLVGEGAFNLLATLNIEF